MVLAVKRIVLFCSRVSGWAWERQETRLVMVALTMWILNMCSLTWRELHSWNLWLPFWRTTHLWRWGTRIRSTLFEERWQKKFEWEGDELVISNKEVVTTLTLGGRCAFDINLEVAKKMGWVVWRESYNDYQLGPNIQQEFNQYRVPTLSSITSDVFDDDGNPCFWQSTMDFLISVCFTSGVFEYGQGVQIDSWS